MYSPRIIERRTAKLQDGSGTRLRRYTPEQSAELTAALDPLWDDAKRATRRHLAPGEAAFIQNELLLSAIDFHYWLRYARIKLDGGGLGPPRQWGSQEIVLRHLARAEDRMWDAKDHGWPIHGVRVLYHKARQLGATMISRLLTMHRMIFTKHINAMAASVDEDKVLELYNRDKTIYEYLPWWMRPAVRFEEKAAHLHFESLNTVILYQQASQKSGLGQGRQFEVSHLTECASWPHPQVIALDFIPTIPQSIHTLCILESTAQGRGNWWHEYTEDARAGQHPEWTYIFVPWYAVESKYRLHPPDNWTPMQTTLAHAAKVRETSPEWLERTIDLDREQLYWYETERASAQAAGELNFFLTNRAATPEESFQHSTQASFSPELLDRLRNATTAPKLYFEVTHAPVENPIG